MPLARASAAFVLLLASLAGCIAASSKDSSQTAMPTLGKELEDLHAAYKKGAITKEEYETTKARMLEKGR